jgi:hypothetical protein
LFELAREMISLIISFVEQTNALAKYGQTHKLIRELFANNP